MLKKGDKIGIVCCSDLFEENCHKKIELLTDALSMRGLVPKLSPYIYKKGFRLPNANQKALALMDFYMDDKIKAIFDISGGDASNGVLPLLDYDVIKKSHKSFWGYSDVTTVLNAIYAKTGSASVLYQIRNIIRSHKERQSADFFDTVMDNENNLFEIDYKFVQGKEMQGTVVGGNARCFLKLAGTEFMPDLKGKILLLEARGGRVEQVESYFSQLRQLGAFDNAAGVLLGTFTQLEAECGVDCAAELILDAVGKKLPVAATRDIGHGADSKAMAIGGEMLLKAL